MAKDELSGADIKVRPPAPTSPTLPAACRMRAALLQRLTLWRLGHTQAICTEAGLLALRERRMRVCMEDFRQAKEKVLYKKRGDVPEGMFI